MASKQNLKTHMIHLVESILIALAILGFTLQQLIANPTTALITVYWFIFIMAIGVIMASIMISLWMVVKYLITPPTSASLL